MYLSPTTRAGTNIAAPELKAVEELRLNKVKEKRNIDADRRITLVIFPDIIPSGLTRAITAFAGFPLIRSDLKPRVSGLEQFSDSPSSLGVQSFDRKKPGCPPRRQETCERPYCRCESNRSHNQLRTQSGSDVNRR